MYHVWHNFFFCLLLKRSCKLHATETCWTDQRNYLRKNMLSILILFVDFPSNSSSCLFVYLNFLVSLVSNCSIDHILCTTIVEKKINSQVSYPVWFFCIPDVNLHFRILLSEYQTLSDLKVLFCMNFIFCAHWSCVTDLAYTVYNYIFCPYAFLPK